MNYSEIRDMVISYSDREDAEVQDRIDRFMRITEARVNRLLKIGTMSVRAKIVLLEGQDYYTLPPDFSGMRAVKMITESGGEATLHLLTPELSVSIGNADGITGVYYTIIGQQLKITPTQSLSSLEITYYQKIPPLTESEPNNWLATTSPDVYIFGVLVEINSFVKDAEAASLWDGRFSQSIKDMEYSDSVTRWSGTPMQIRIG